MPKIKNKTLKNSLLAEEPGMKKTKMVKVVKKILGKKAAHVVARGQEKRAARKEKKALKRAAKAMKKAALAQQKKVGLSLRETPSPTKPAPAAPTPKAAARSFEAAAAASPTTTSPPRSVRVATPKKCGCSVDGKHTCRKCTKQERAQEGYQAYCSPPSSPVAVPVSTSDRSSPSSHKQVALDDFLGAEAEQELSRQQGPAPATSAPPSTYEEDMELMLALKFAQAAKERKSNEKNKKHKPKKLKKPSKLGFFARLKAKRDRNKKEKSITVKPVWVTPPKAEKKTSKKGFLTRCMFPKRSSPSSDDATYLEETRSENPAAAATASSTSRRKKSADLAVSRQSAFAKTKAGLKMVSRDARKAINRKLQPSLGASLHQSGQERVNTRARVGSDSDLYRRFDDNGNIVSA